MGHATLTTNLALPVVVGVLAFAVAAPGPPAGMASPAARSTTAVSATPTTNPTDAGRAAPTSDAAPASAGPADAALLRIAREVLAGRDGVAEATRFVAPDVLVDDRAWSGTTFTDRDAWRAHLVVTYGLTLDEVHHQRAYLDPQGAVVQQRRDYVAGLGGAAHVVEFREYARDGISHLHTAVSIHDLRRRPAAGDPSGYDELERLVHRYLTAWSTGDRDRIASLYRTDARLHDGLVGPALTGSAAIARSGRTGPDPATADRRLEAIPGTDDPAVYLDGRTPSTTSSLVLVHAPNGTGACPGRLAVHLELEEGRISRERRYHDAASDLSCLGRRTTGWWQRLGPPEAVDVATGRLSVGDVETVLLGSSPELEQLLTWALGRFEDAGLRPPAMASITFAPHSGRCQGIAGQVETGADGVRVLLCLDTKSACADRGCTTASRYGQLTVLHELAHAWETTWLDDHTREAYLEHRDLEVWHGQRAIPWEERGVEQAAETIMWGLLERVMPLPRLGDPACEDLEAGYRLLTGGEPINGGCAPAVPAGS
jgi:hypothetical protein